MIDKWLDCFARWHAGYQMIFSTAAMILVFLLLILGGSWFSGLWGVFLENLSVWFRGYPDEDKDEVREKPVVAQQGMVFNWREEFRRMQEEHAYQARLQAELQEQMEQAARAVPPPQLPAPAPPPAPPTSAPASLPTWQLPPLPLPAPPWPESPPEAPPERSLNA